MSAVVPNAGNIRQLDRKPEPDERVTADNAGDPAWVARLFMRMLRDIAGIKRRFWPNHIDFEDKVVDATGTTLYQLAHGLNGRVRWWVADWSGSAAPALSKHSSTTTNVLVLVSYTAGTATIRVEEAG